MSNNNLEVDEKNNKKILPFVVFCLVIVVIISISIFSILSLLSPKNKFFNLLGNTVTDTFSKVSEIEKTPLGNLLFRTNNPKLTVETSMSGDIETKDNDIKEWLNDLKKFNVNSKVNLDKLNNYSDIELEFLIDDTKLLSGNIVKNNKLTSVNVNDITDGYITIDENNLEKLWEDSEYEGPATITGQLDWMKDLNFSKEEIKNLEQAIITMGSTFSASFEDDDFTEGISEVKSDEESIECEYIDFNMSSDKFNEALVASLEKIVVNEKYVDVFHKIISLLNEFYGLTPDTREEFLIQFKALINQYRQLDFGEKSLSIIRLYHKDGKILKIEILSEDYNKKFFDFTMVTGKDSAYYMYKTDMIIYEDRVTNLDNKTTHLITVNYIDYETGGIVSEYGKEITFNIDNSEINVENFNMVEKVKLVNYEDNDAKPELSITKDYNFKVIKEDDSSKIEVVLKDVDDSFVSNLGIKMNIKENPELIVKEISEETDFDTTTKTKTEILEKKKKIIANWNKLEKNNSKRIEKLETAVSMYLSLFIPEVVYSDDFEVR